MNHDEAGTMAKRWLMRIEYDGMMWDVSVGAMTLDEARQRTQERYPSYAHWDWRGSVAFIEHTKPAEEVRT